MADETDKRIADLINFYIQKARTQLKVEGAELVKSAFMLIQRDRQNQCLSDEIYSSAEHYLTARHMASYLSGPGMKIISLGYDAFKLFGGTKGVEKLKLGNNCPASELTARQTKWKLLGASDGNAEMFNKDKYIQPVSAENAELRAIGGLNYPGL